MTKTQEIEEYLRGHPGITAYQAAKNMGRRGWQTAEVQAVIDARKGHPANHAYVAAPKRLSGRPLAELFDQFDDVKKVRAAMKMLPRDHFYDDDQIRREASVAPDRWRAVAAIPELAEFHMTLPNRKRVWMRAQDQQELARRINLDHVGGGSIV